MLPYLLLFVFLGICSILEYDKNLLLKRYIYVSSFIILLLFVGFRHNIGLDIFAYQEYFNLVKNSNFSLDFSNKVGAEFMSFGFGFYILNFVFSRIGNFQLLVFVISLFNLLALYLFLKRSFIDRKLSFIVILFSFTLFREFDILRQSIAFHIFLLSLLYVDKPKKYFILNLIGMLFHTSAFLLLIIYPLLKKTFSKNTIITILVLFIANLIHPLEFIKLTIFLIGSFSNITLFHSLFAYYTYLNYPAGFSFTADIPSLIFLLILIFNYDYYIKLDAKKKVIVSVFLLFILNSIFFSEVSEIVSRCDYYFFIGIAGMFSIFYPTFKFNHRNVILYMPFIFLILKLYLMMQTPAMRITYTPYSNYLINSEPYDDFLYSKRVESTAEYYQKKMQE